MDSFDCGQLQQEELEVLESIYPDCVSSSTLSGTIKLDIPVEFGEPRNVSITHNGSYQNLSLSMLPPLLLDITLPDTYPSLDPPRLESIQSTHFWLPRIAKLKEELLTMFTPGDGVLYAWVDFIRNGQLLESLKLLAPDDSTVIVIPHPAPHIISPLLIAYNSASTNSRFSQNTYSCSICLAHHKGSKCLELSCSHIFCRPCLQDFWQMCITEGDISRVGCPDPACVKDVRSITEDELSRVMGAGEVKRWRWLKEKYTFEQDPTIMPCPMKFCQKPVFKQVLSDTEAESGWERLRTCPSCSYSFCSFCKHTWHGPISPCTAATEDLCREYLSYASDSPEREMILRRFGRKTVLKLVAAYEDELLNQELLASMTTSCPGCQIPVEKSMGCNHMTCSRCRQHFCYRCGESLHGNPYEHFSTRSLPCYNKLFDDDDWVQALNDP